MSSEGPEKNRIDWIYIMVVLIFAVPLLLFVGIIFFLDSFLGSSDAVMGVSGFVQEVIWRTIVVVLAFAAVIFFIQVIRKPVTLTKGKAGCVGILLTKAGCAVGILACLALSFILLRTLVLDIPYLSHPKTDYLYRLGFDMGSTDDGEETFSMEGVGMDGENHILSMTSDLYEEGEKLWQENSDLRAKAVYLPHTEVLFSLEYITNLDEQADKLYPALPSLPDDWRSFSIQINNAVYSLPVSLSDFFSNGWYIKEGQDVPRKLQGTDSPYASYDSANVTLTNDREQNLFVTVYNAAKEAVPLTDGTVGTLSATYENYDFSGTDLILPGGIRLGWSRPADVIDIYGQPDPGEDDEEYRYTLSGHSGSYEIFRFNDSGYLTGIMICTPRSPMQPSDYEA